MVPVAGGMWRGVKRFDALEKALDDEDHEDEAGRDEGDEGDAEKGECWGEFEGMVAGLHEWELTGSRAARDRFAKQLAVVYGYFAEWNWSGEGSTPRGNRVRSTIAEAQRTRGMMMMR